MKLALCTISAILSGAHLVGAFSPQSRLHEQKTSFESFQLKSSRAEPLPEKASEPLTTASRTATSYKRWGIDNTNEDEYWYDSRIHTLGNVGILGAVHAALAPVSTRMIDEVAYDGVDIRRRVAEELSTKYHKEKAKVLDMCCGVGFSTRALVQAFPDAEKIVGVDTSSEMLSMARFITAHVSHIKPWWDLGHMKLSESYNKMISQGQKIQKDAKHFCATSFMKGNAEKTDFKDGSFDVVTIMYAFHEAPQSGRQRILKEARRLLSPGGVLAIIDIATDYEPSASMLAGEPYVLEYQKNIHHQLRSQKGFQRSTYKTLVEGHVGMWTMRRAAAY